METPHVSVIIVNWNGKNVLETCLSSVSSTRYPSFDIIVVDNGSTDGSVSMVTKFPAVRLIRNGENVGFSRAKS